MVKSLFIIIFLVNFIISCTFTATRNVDLNESGKEILSQIKASYDFDQVDAFKTSKSGSESKELVTLELVNGRNLPADSLLYPLGGEFASAVYRVLDTPNHYNAIRVVFKRMKGNFVANTSQSTSFDYPIIKKK